ncbi:glycine cleavage system protein GcvH [Geobacter sulfurreducens]|jgi:glycine cleavage system H protein|uniref:Glycine cleavage system H protein n=1 Tax=Geobacter sulfurreducens (strain ATCC 51573 / DSM 12127 / PCA) TaxID=243231 RepID=Q74BM3_GEOSL|nr:glycine cleavage system protein GcvH [Geobacter sulfurreducens]AAR35394.1 glycine cleavage system lipoyl carrier protein GcvH [Geobacter sulfurreducens PCA]ADI84852.1 lipoyl carrier protein LarG [Geobacter sulfurreducens KN400]AJY68249.1 glycine cleavage system protein H [Geobacter sulfurreducens]QVW33960.1 glycine cleavage system protein GcvH [Geobacter sulfurreducens]UAC02750.1 glycine cleavage system protein GcvH [Geobacter sulfurreducens]
MDFPEELKYSKEHVWVREEGDRAVIGLTDYAQDALGTISAIELPTVGDELEQEDSFGSLEARKTASELYAPISGTVLEVNEELDAAPEVINDDPYDGGWIAAVSLDDPEELKSLLSAEDYAEYVSQTDEDEE